MRAERIFLGATLIASGILLSQCGGRATKTGAGIHDLDDVGASDSGASGHPSSFPDGAAGSPQTNGGGNAGATDAGGTDAGDAGPAPRACTTFGDCPDKCIECYHGFTFCVGHDCVYGECVYGDLTCPATTCAPEACAAPCLLCDAGDAGDAGCSVGYCNQQGTCQAEPTVCSSPCPCK